MGRFRARPPALLLTAGACKCCLLPAIAAGKQLISLHVNQDDPEVQRMYSKAGYREVARDNPFLARFQGMRPRILLEKPLR